MENGIYCVGIFKGISTRNFVDRNGNDRAQHSLVISNPYTDQYGNTQTDVVNVDISSDVYNDITSKSGAWLNKRLLVPVVVRSRAGGRFGAWTSYFLPNGAKVSILPDKSEKAA